MKYCLLLLFICLISCARPGLCLAESFTTIQGKVGEERIKEVSLYSIHDGNAIKISTTQVAENGSFGFAFDTFYEGFYLISGNPFCLQRLYIKKGEHIRVILFEKQLEWDENCSPENKLLHEWESLLAGFKARTYYAMLGFEKFTPTQLTGSLDTLITEARKYSRKLRTASPAFQSLMDGTVKLDMCYLASFHLINRENPGDTVVKSFRRVITPSAFSGTAVAGNSFGWETLQNYWSTRQTYDHITPTLEMCFQEMEAPEVRGLLLLSELSEQKSYPDFEKLMKAYSKYLSPTQLPKAHHIGAKLFEPRLGEMAADFTYPDANGKLISLSDFRGKVVVVGTWASWCAPCVKHLPDFCETSKLYSPDSVVFIGVSFNSLKEKGNWLKAIEKFGLANTTLQLLAGGFTELAEYYRLDSVGKYLIFDREGRIASLDAPCEKQELKTLIDKVVRE